MKHLLAKMYRIQNDSRHDKISHLLRRFLLEEWLQMENKSSRVDSSDLKNGPQLATHPLELILKLNII